MYATIDGFAASDSEYMSPGQAETSNIDFKHSWLESDLIDWQTLAGLLL